VWGQHMRSRPDWRSPTYEQDFAQFDYGDWAQEFVRRSPDYRRDYEAVRTIVASGEGGEQQEMEVLAQRWGMIFPV
jgi:hypothetical protein